MLAPARDLACGLAAIDSGADAVYIGGPSFGARVNAGNSLEDIRQLCNYAHEFGAKVHVALNTILTDEELKQARELAFRLYDAGADALILQDLGLLMGDLPPLELHASTQQNNSTPEKALFLEKTGFSQIVLARELSLQEIKNIGAAVTHARLEFFVHGALCAGVSGRCYLSEYLTGRSANRGACAQLCRVPMSLKTSSGEYLARDKYLLSLKDLCHGDSLLDLMDAGIRSFKIEGRLKDEGYVRNVTAWYRNRLDKIFAGNSSYMRSSCGTTETAFVPDVSKSFNRGFTRYNLYEEKANYACFDSPKYVGTKVGEITGIRGRYITVTPEKGVTFHNGDKLSYFAGGDISGFRVSVARGGELEIFQSIKDLKPGMTLYRNKDADFERVVAQTGSSVRRLLLDLSFRETSSGFIITAGDETGVSSSVTWEGEHLEQTRNPQVQLKNIEDKLRKIGGTIYRIRNLTLDCPYHWFIPVSELNNARRQVLDQLARLKQNAGRERKETVSLNIPLPGDELNLGYQANIYNQSARDFYCKHGVADPAPAFETEVPEKAVLMYCRQCLRYCFGMCPKYNNLRKTEQLILIIGGKEFDLKFDCGHCIMQVCSKKD